MKKMNLFLALFLGLISSSAIAARFNQPNWQGYALDWCRNFDNGCGRPAADLFCQRMGFAATIGFVKLPHVNVQTIVIGQGQVCDPRRNICHSFATINCR